MTIAWVDEYGHAWFEYSLRGESGQVEEYCTAILDDESWVYVNPG